MFAHSVNFGLGACSHVVHQQVNKIKMCMEPRSCTFHPSNTHTHISVSLTLVKQICSMCMGSCIKCCLGASVGMLLKEKFRSSEIVSGVI